MVHWLLGETWRERRISGITGSGTLILLDYKRHAIVSCSRFVAKNEKLFFFFFFFYFWHLWLDAFYFMKIWAEWYVLLLLFYTIYILRNNYLFRLMSSYDWSVVGRNCESDQRWTSPRPNARIVGLQIWMTPQWWSSHELSYDDIHVTVSAGQKGLCGFDTRLGSTLVSILHLMKTDDSSELKTGYIISERKSLAETISLSCRSPGRLSIRQHLRNMLVCGRRPRRVRMQYGLNSSLLQ